MIPRPRAKGPGPTQNAPVKNEAREGAQEISASDRASKRTGLAKCISLHVFLSKIQWVVMVKETPKEDLCRFPLGDNHPSVAGGSMCILVRGNISGLAAKRTHKNHCHLDGHVKSCKCSYGSTCYALQKNPMADQCCARFSRRRVWQSIRPSGIGAVDLDGLRPRVAAVDSLRICLSICHI